MIVAFIKIGPIFIKVMLPEIYFAKEAKKVCPLLRKAPRLCQFNGFMKGIKVRAQWRSGCVLGNHTPKLLKGNRLLATRGKLGGNPTRPKAAKFTFHKITLSH